MTPEQRILDLLFINLMLLWHAGLKHIVVIVPVQETQGEEYI